MRQSSIYRWPINPVSKFHRKKIDGSARTTVIIVAVSLSDFSPTAFGATFSGTAALDLSTSSRARLLLARAFCETESEPRLWIGLPSVLLDKKMTERENATQQEVWDKDSPRMLRCEPADMLPALLPPRTECHHPSIIVGLVIKSVLVDIIRCSTALETEVIAQAGMSKQNDP
jgi:hypothetical protein